MDTPTIVGVIIFVSSLVTARGGRRGQGAWRSAYFVMLLALIHLAFLYQFFGATLGRMGSEEWAAITAAGIAGVAADDDADAVGLLLVVLGIFQVFLLAGLINFRPAG